MLSKTTKYFAMILPIALFSGAAMAQQAAADTYSEEELKQFAAAYDQVVELQEKHKERMKQAEGHEQTQKLQRQYDEAMVQTIRDAGLSLDEYSAMVQAATNDEAVAERVDKYRKQQE